MHVCMQLAGSLECRLDGSLGAWGWSVCVWCVVTVQLTLVGIVREPTASQTRKGGGITYKTDFIRIFGDERKCTYVEGTYQMLKPATKAYVSRMKSDFDGHYVPLVGGSYYHRSDCRE